jgi:glycosyltransferase involved in cell wall biosynthesis
MACGTPVVSSSATALPEVAGEAALYSDPGDPEKFADDLYRAFTDAALRTALVEKGRKNLQRFNWTNTAMETLAVYQHALQTPLPKAAYA